MEGAAGPVKGEDAGPSVLAVGGSGEEPEASFHITLFLLAGSSALIPDCWKVRAWLCCQGLVIWKTKC